MCPVPIVAPYVGGRLRNDGRGRRTQFSLEGERVRLERQQVAVRPDDFELVGAALADFGQEDFPYARISTAAHQAPPPIPPIKVAHH